MYTRCRAATALVAAVFIPTAAEAQIVAREAAKGGVVGSAVVGLLASLVSIASCDAADCSFADAWVEGGIPGMIVGGFLGAGLGAVIGANAADPLGRPAAGPRTGVVVRASGVVSRATSHYVDQRTGGVRAMIGLRHDGWSFGPGFERQGGAGWRVSSYYLHTRLERRASAFRPFAEVELGRFQWEVPVTYCGHHPSPCRVADRYLGAAAGVGASVGLANGPWALVGVIRFHHAGKRPTDPVIAGLRGSRQLRQVAVGIERAVPW